MLISKNKSKDNKSTFYNFIIKKSFLKDTKNPDYVKLSIRNDFMIGLDDNKEIAASKLINEKLLIDRSTKTAAK